MIYLGIDPGVRKLGYAVVHIQAGLLAIIDAGVMVDLDTYSQIDRSHYYHRMLEIHDFIQALYQQYDIQTMAIEKLFFTTHNQSNAEFVYAVRGMICMQAYQQSIKILEPTPIQLKKAITGNAKASKETMIAMIMKLYRLTHTPEYHDSADALGLALYAQRLSSTL